MTVDWDRYQACTEVCGAALGKPCRELSGFVVAAGTAGGVAIGLEGGVVEVDADEPHSSRKLRAAAARAGGDR